MLEPQAATQRSWESTGIKKNTLSAWTSQNVRSYKNSPGVLRVMFEWDKALPEDVGKPWNTYMKTVPDVVTIKFLKT